MDSLFQDLRYALRSLAAHRTYAGVVVITLALGIGANTAIFSVVDGVLLRPLPYARGNELVLVQQDRPKAGIEGQPFSVHEIRDYREQSTTLAGLVEYHDMWFVLLGRPEPERVQTGVVSANFFEVMGVPPLLGRTFRADDEAPGAPAVLVLSHSYWQRSFGGDASVVGKDFRMNDRPHTVVGVLPPIPQYPVENDVYMPTSACPFRSRQQFIDNRDARMMRAFARLKPGVTTADYQKDLALVAARLQQAYPQSYPERTGYRAVATPLQDELTESVRPTLVVLLGTAGFVLLIVCASLANLTVARVVRRERELAVRAALGAGRSRLLRQLLTESVLLSVAGGTLGVLLAWWSLDLLIAFTERFTTRAAEISIDYRVLLFAFAASIVTGLVFGTLPAWSGRADLAPSLRDGSRTSGGRAGIRKALIVAQVAVSLMLLVGAGLLLRSLVKLHQIDPGFSTDRVLTMRIDLNFSKYRTPEPRAAYFTSLLDGLGSLPGVSQVTIAGTFPLNERGPSTTRFVVEGQTTDAASAPQASFRAISPHYFETIGVPLLRGRDFTSSDTRDAASVVIVSQSLMRRAWGADDALGKRISIDGGRNWATVVGVVGDARQQLDRIAGDDFYSPVLQTPLLSTTVLMKTAGDPMSLARQVRQVVYGIDPEQPVDRFRSLDDVRADALARPRQTATLLAIFAGLALLITATGLGGVIAFSVNQRTQEFGVRMALGAPRASVLRLVVGEGLRLVLLGLAIGMAGAVALTRVLSDLLYGIEPTDAFTFLSVSLVLLGVAMIACFLPARRAASVDPLQALRTA